MSAILKHDFGGHHSLIDLTSVDNAEACIQHYNRCKAKSPADTSACLVLPKSSGKLGKYLAKYKLLRTLPVGTPFYQAGDQVLNTEHKLVVYHDPVVTQHYLNLSAFDEDNAPLCMDFPGRIAGRECNLLVDTGASSAFVDTSFVHEKGLAFRAASGSVNCGGKATAEIQGVISVIICLNTYRERIKLYMTDLPEAHPVILGSSWIRRHRAILDHDKLEMRFRQGSMFHCLSCPETKCLRRGERNITLSFMQTKSLLAEGCPALLATIQHSAEAELADHNPDPSNEAADILRDYSDVFQDIPGGLPPARAEAFRIKLEDHDPFSSRGYRLTPKEKDQVEAQITEFLAKG